MFKAHAITLAAWLLVLRQYASADTVDWSAITNSRGDRLPDFSFCGYHASNKPLPSTPTSPSVILTPSAGDQTLQIQAALDETAALGGGVVELGPGTFNVSSGLSLPSNTTLRGSGVGFTQLSVIELISGVPLISLGNGTNTRVAPLATYNITDEYVGIGASTVTVQDTSGLQAGQSVFVSRAVTAEWVRYNGMADLIRDGKNQTWIQDGVVVQQPRVIKEVDGSKVTFTVSLTDALDKRYMNPYLATFSPPPTSEEIGLEDLSVTLSPTCSGKALDSKDACGTAAISIAPWTVNSFVRRVNLTGFNNFITVERNASRITLESVGLFRDADTDNSAGYPADISIQGSQVLVRDSGQYGRPTARAFTVVTQSLTPGPNAVLRHVAQSSAQQLYPHQRWAHGFLAEDTDCGVVYQNRGTAGSGHGWAINAGVAWNVRGEVLVQSPPLGVNWGVGCAGSVASGTNGTMIETGEAVTPRSLYEAQLARRVGRETS